MLINRWVGLKKLTLLGVIYLLTVNNIVASYGQNLFTGTFVADSRPHKIMHLVLTQTKDSVSGSLIIVMSDGRGSTKSDNLVLRGSTDGNAITLISAKLLGDSVINGRKQGEKIVLMFPTDSGSISNITFLSTTEDHFNQLLKQWQEELSINHSQQQKELTNIQNERQKLTKLANALTEGINTVKSSRIRQNLDSLKSALDYEQSVFHKLENDLAKLKLDASLRPMTCYQVNSVVDYDFNSIMMYSYDSNLGYAQSIFMDVLRELEDRLSNVEPLSTEIRQAAQAFNQAIKGSKYPLPELNTLPGDEKRVLEQYQALAISVHNELTTLRAAHSDISNKAKEIMREGEVILNKTRALVRCH